MKYCIIAFYILLIYGCGSQRVKPSAGTGPKDTEIPAQESWHSTVVFSDSGLTKAVLNAGHIRIYEKTRETLLDSNIKVDFYDPREIITTTLTAKRGKVDDKTQNLYAIDSVVAINDSGVTIRTEELMWRNSDRKIVSDKFVTITTKVENIQGYGFESDQGLKNYVIYNITYITRRDSLNQ